MHGPKEKRFSSKLARSGKFGDATVESHDRIKPARSHPGALYLGNHPAFKPQVVTLPQISGCLSKRPTFGPAAAPLGGVSKEGAAAPSLCRLKGRSRRGRPKSPSWRVFWTGRGRFSLQDRNGGASAQPSSWLSPILRGCPLPLLKIPTRRCFRLAHLASWLHTVPVVNGVLPPPALDVMPPKMLARTAGFFHFFASIYTIYTPYMYH